MKIEFLGEEDGTFEYMTDASPEFPDTLSLIFAITPDPLGDDSAECVTYLADEDGNRVEIPDAQVHHKTAPFLFKAWARADTEADDKYFHAESMV